MGEGQKYYILGKYTTLWIGWQHYNLAYNKQKNYCKYKLMYLFKKYAVF